MYILKLHIITITIINESRLSTRIYCQDFYNPPLSFELNQKIYDPRVRNIL